MSVASLEHALPAAIGAKAEAPDLRHAFTKLTTEARAA
jgi:hypothetical protein